MIGPVKLRSLWNVVLTYTSERGEWSNDFYVATTLNVGEAVPETATLNFEPQFLPINYLDIYDKICRDGTMALRSQVMAATMKTMDAADADVTINCDSKEFKD